MAAKAFQNFVCLNFSTTKTLYFIIINLKTKKVIGANKTESTSEPITILLLNLVSGIMGILYISTNKFLSPSCSRVHCPTEWVTGSNRKPTNLKKKAAKKTVKKAVKKTVKKAAKKTTKKRA